MINSYTPIDCGFHDELLTLATLQKVCDIVYKNEDKNTVSTSNKIQDVFSKGKEEFLQLANGVTIRLDYIISVNGKKLPTAC